MTMKQSGGLHAPPLPLEAHSLLAADCNWLAGYGRHNSHIWETFDFFDPTDVSSGASTAPYFVEGLPVELHIHGLGNLDFTDDLDHLDLDLIQTQLESEGILAVPTLFLRRDHLSAFECLLREYTRRRNEGGLRNVLGFALEGPVLNPLIGASGPTRWLPTTSEWERIASCGRNGLKYTVLSPDAPLPPGYLDWVVKLLLDTGVGLSLGHFDWKNPTIAVASIERVLRIAERRQASRTSIHTDHVFDGLPQPVTLVSGDAEHHLQHERRLARPWLGQWSFANLERHLGLVTATLLRAARDGRLTLGMSFGKEYIEGEIACRVVELVGASSVVAMTDRNDTLTSRTLNDLDALRSQEVPLWEGVASSTPPESRGINEQAGLLRSLGFGEAEVWEMTSLLPQRLLGLTQPVGYSYVTSERSHLALPMR